MAAAEPITKENAPVALPGLARALISAGKLQVEPTAVFNGNCNMGTNVVELKNEMANAVNQ